MKRKSLFSRVALLLCAISLLVTSCSKDDALPDVNYIVKLDMPINVDSPVLTNGTATLTNVQSGSTYTISEFALSGTQYTGTVTLPQGSYNVSVTGNITYEVDGTEVSSEVKSESDNIAITESATTTTLSLSTYNAQEGFVISEIFFTGTLTPEGKQYSGDQYFKITNNSSETLYADGIAILESSFLTVSKYDYTPDIMSQAMTADAIYCIPGTGNDHPVLPGKSLVIALNAINHKEANSNSIDLSTADFEFYDESSNSNYLDTDNTEVPNLDKWYCYTATYFSLHNRGFKAYAIAKPEVDKETFLANYLYTYSYTMSLSSGNYTMTGKGYKVPNAWILDAVNLSVSAGYEWIVTSPTLDSGWSYCGTTTSDATRYGKAVVRKVEKTENGRDILKDTNNSTDDFDAEATPSLFQ
jgi:hypothetical protein